MLEYILLAIIAIFVPIILLSGFKLHGVPQEKSLRIIALSLLCIEIFKFFYSAAFYSGGATPKESLSFTLITLLIPLCLISAFSTPQNKIAKTMASVVSACALVPLVVAAFNGAIYSPAGELDSHSMLAGAYFVQAGLLLAFAALIIPLKKITLTHALLSIAFLTTAFAATLLTNYAWDVSLLFKNKPQSDIPMLLLSLVCPVGAYLTSRLILNKGGKK